MSPCGRKGEADRYIWPAPPMTAFAFQRWKKYQDISPACPTFIFLIADILGESGVLCVSLMPMWYDSSVSQHLAFTVKMKRSTMQRPFPQWRSDDVSRCSLWFCAFALTGYVHGVIRGRVLVKRWSQKSSFWEQEKRMMRKEARVWRSTAPRTPPHTETVNNIRPGLPSAG